MPGFGLTTRDFDFAQRDFSFKVTVKGSRWLIEAVSVAPLGVNANSVFASFMAGTDGTNIYSVQTLSTNFNASDARALGLKKLKEVESKLSARGDVAALNQIRRQIDRLAKQITEESKVGHEAKSPRNQAVGSICVGTVPLYSGVDPIAPIWLAFCLGRNFETNNIIVPGIFSPTAKAAVGNAFRPI